MRPGHEEIAGRWSAHCRSARYIVCVYVFALSQACQRVSASSGLTCERKPRERLRCWTGRCLPVRAPVSRSRSSSRTTRVRAPTVPTRTVLCQCFRHPLDHTCRRRLDRSWLLCRLPRAEWGLLCFCGVKFLPGLTDVKSVSWWRRGAGQWSRTQPPCQPAKLKPSYDPRQTWPLPRLWLLISTKWRHTIGLLAAMFVGDLLANRRLRTLLLFWLDVRSLENI